MFNTLRNAWKVADIRKKLLYTFFMLLVFRLVGMLPVQGINNAAVKALTGRLDALNILNMMTGNSFEQMTIMAMGITPYINASIIIQLLTIAIPSLERLAKEGGEEGKEKINKITRYSTVVFAALQAIGILAALRSMPFGAEVGKVLLPAYDNFFGLLSIGVVMAGGTALAMWIGERITAKGIGNGISMLIFAGIISNIFNGMLTAFLGLIGVAANNHTTLLQFILLVGVTLLIVTAVTFVDLGERRVPVQYAKRVVGRKMYGGQSTHIPIKVMSVGVLPLIFAYSFMSVPGTLITILGPNSGLAGWWHRNMTDGAFLNMLVLSLLIIAFTYFYSSISFNPQDIAKNINQQGGTIPGIRSGRTTVDFLAKTTNRLTLFAGIFLAVLATVPTFLRVWQNVQIPFAASSMLICVSVAIETVRQLEAQLVMRNYDGFL